MSKSTTLAPQRRNIGRTPRDSAAARGAGKCRRCDAVNGPGVDQHVEPLAAAAPSMSTFTPNSTTRAPSGGAEPRARPAAHHIRPVTPCVPTQRRARLLSNTSHAPPRDRRHSRHRTSRRGTVERAGSSRRRKECGHRVHAPEDRGAGERLEHRSSVLPQVDAPIENRHDRTIR